MPGIPCRIDDEVDEWVGDGLVAAQAQHHLAVGFALEVNPDALDRSRILKTLRTENLGAGDRDVQRIRLGRTDLGQCDFGPQRLAKCRLHGDPTERQRACSGGIQPHRQGGRDGQKGGFAAMHGW